MTNVEFEDKPGVKKTYILKTLLITRFQTKELKTIKHSTKNSKVVKKI